MLWLKELSKQILGNVFETAVFSELVKSYGQKNIFYWRTKDKKEIDFILRIKNKFFPLEAKLNFTKAGFRNLEYFVKHYGNAKGYGVCGLRGKKCSDLCFFPWEIKAIIKNAV